jgi:ribosome biogenesis GTPase / thiamine phosphate phosphatase
VARELDEDDVRIRPGRGKSRRRTKDRPDHDQAVPARVVSVDRGRYGCVVDQMQVTAMKSRELGRKSIVVGDRVALVGDIDSDHDSLARIVRIEPRTTVLRRTADDTDPVERVIVANADQLAIVAALADPEPRPRLIDRFLVAAYDAGLDPLLILTKADLHPPDDLVAAYGALDIPTVVSDLDQARSGGTANDLLVRLAGRTTVLVGHSGVGKSTLVNGLVPGADRQTGAVNLVTGRGRHTSSSTVVLELPGTSGWVIDTPGIRSFGLAHVDPSRVVGAFPDLAEGAKNCPRGCSHDEPDCALDEWVATGHAPQARLDSLRRLLRSRSEPDAD